jgi:hypothetical protein
MEVSMPAATPTKFDRRPGGPVVLPLNPRYFDSKRANEEGNAPYWVPIYRQTDGQWGFECDPLMPKTPLDFAHMFVDEQYTGLSSGELEWTDGRCCRFLVFEIAPAQGPGYAEPALAQADVPEGTADAPAQDGNLDETDQPMPT